MSGDGDVIMIIVSNRLMHMDITATGAYVHHAREWQIAKHNMRASGIMEGQIEVLGSTTQYDAESTLMINLL